MRRAPLLFFAAASVAATASAAPAGQSALLNGMHDIEATAFMTGATSGCDKGWITDLQYIGTSGTPAADCHDAAVAAGVSIIQRLDVNGSASFPVNTADAPGYAGAFASFATQCPNLHVWIVGNEPNFTVNNSDPSTYASPYAEAYAQVHAKLHAVAGHASDLVLAAPASPYSPFCICSMHQIIQQIKSRGVTPDGFAVHAYTQAQTPADFGTLVSLVTSEQMSASNDGCGYPFHWQLRIYRDWIGAIEGEGLTGSPVYITETGNACAPQQGNACYPNQNLGYFQALYAEIANWNANASHTTKIRAVTPYRWTTNDDGTGRDFAIGTRPQLQVDVTDAFANKYAWTTSCGPVIDDGGVPTDSGTGDGGKASDGGVTSDAGVDAGSGSSSGGGCSCRAGASASKTHTTILELVGIGALALSRRRQRPAPKKKANVTKAMNLVARGASGFKIVGLTRKLDAADEVAVFEALAARASPPEEAPDLLAKAYARAGRFGDAVRAGKKGKYPGTLQEVGEAALDGGDFANAETAFAAAKKPSAAVLVGLAIAQKKAGKDPKAALARAEAANVTKKAIDFKSATSCYEHVGVAIAAAMIASVRGDAASAKKTLANARKTFQQVPQKSVRKECDDQLAAPADPQWWGSPIARHAGLRTASR